MRLVFASNNDFKLNEIRNLLPAGYEILSLKDLKCEKELAETGATLEKNALQKARYVYEKYQTNCFADDTGLETEALNGLPGVYSARYAGKDKDAAANMEKLLGALKNYSNRKARFRTVIAGILRGKEYVCEGITEGEILKKRKGAGGFGYDPVFLPLGSRLSFAEMSLEEKNKISHRAKALKKFIELIMKEAVTEL